MPDGRAADIAVLGGGAVGICAALRLQRSGRDVVLIERAEPGGEASGHNGGIVLGDCVPTGTPEVIRSIPRMLRDPLSPMAVRWRYLPRLAPWLTRFALASRADRVEPISVALYSLMSGAIDAYRALVAGTEAEAVLHKGGLLFGYRRDGALSPASFALQLRSRRGMRYEVLDGDAIAERHPVLAGRLRQAMFLPDAVYTTDPLRLVRALVDQFVQDGGRLQRAEATGFDQRNGTVHAVRTGERSVPVGAVVIAAGPWSRRLLRRLGTDVPLQAERGYGIDLPDAGVALDIPMILSDFHVSLAPHWAGLRLTGLDELAGLAAPPDFRLADRVLRAARLVFPELRTAGATRWMKARPSTPDSLPIIGRAPRQRNAYLAFGHGHKGLSLAAVTGKLVEEMVSGTTPSVDLAPFSPGRFSLRRRLRGSDSRPR